MSSSTILRVIHALWAFFLAIFSSRRQKNPSSPAPDPPTTLATHHYETDSLRSWQNDKQQFLRRPSLLKASAHQTLRPKEKKKRHRPFSGPPPPTIYVEDWSSLGLNMNDFFVAPSAFGTTATAGITPAMPNHPLEPVIEIKADNTTFTHSPNSLEHTNPVSNGPPEDQSALTQPTAKPSLKSQHQAADSPQSHARSHRDTLPLPITARRSRRPATPKSDLQSDPPVLSFSAGQYASNALSAVSGFLWDPPSSSIDTATSPHSTPLPSDFTVTSPTPRPQSIFTPYTDIFDIGMYMHRLSRDRNRDSTNFPGDLELGVTDEMLEDLKNRTRPVSIYDVQAAAIALNVSERDRYRSAAYSSCVSSPSPTRSPPRRVPLGINTAEANTGLNFGTGSMFEEKGAAPKLDFGGTGPFMTQEEMNVNMFAFAESV